MSIVLRILAGLVMVLGLGSLVAPFVVALGGNRDAALNYLGTGVVILGIVGAALLVTFGGILWALARLAYRSGGTSVVIETSSLADPRPPQVRLYGFGSVLRILGWLQVGIGVAGLGIFGCYAFSRLNRPGVALECLIVAGLCLAYASIGGILVALTRIAYPPTPGKFAEQPPGTAYPPSA
jgi:hypothetical protein